MANEINLYVYWLLASLFCEVPIKLSFLFFVLALFLIDL